MNKPRVAFIYTEWNVNDYRRENNAYGGIGYYRIIKPALALKKLGYDVSIYGKEISEWGNMETAFARLFISHDIIYIKQVSHPQTASNLLAAAQHYKRKVIVDIDDNFLDIRPDNPAYDSYKVGSAERYALTAFISLADGLVTSTEPLKETYLRLNPNIDVIPNCNQLEDWKPNEKKDDGIIRIGYAGGTSHNADLDLILPVMKKIFKKYKNVKFEVLGAADTDKATKMVKKLGVQANQIQFYAGTPAFDKYPETIAKLGWDIGLAPLVDDKFNICKSHIKWMEYASHKFPTIASKTYPYFEDIQGTKTIEDGVTGLLCTTSSDWEENLTLLIENEEKRKEIGQNAYNFVKEKWQYDQHAQKWANIIEKYSND